MSIKTIMTPKEALEYMRCHGISIGETTLKAGLFQGVFPFGDATEPDARAGVSSCTYRVYGKLLQKWVAERSGIEEGKEAWQ